MSFYYMSSNDPNLENIGNIDTVQSIGKVEAVANVQKIENVDIAALKRELATLRIQQRRGQTERIRLTFAAFLIAIMVFALSLKVTTGDDGKAQVTWNLDIQIVTTLLAAITAVYTGLSAVKNGGSLFNSEKVNDNTIEEEIKHF